MSRATAHRRALAAPLAALVAAGCVHAHPAPGPRPLETPAALLAALEAGRPVKVVVHYARCTAAGDGPARPAPDATGGFQVTAFEHFAAGAVGNERAYTALSEARLIVHPRHGPVWNYARLRVPEVGEVEVAVKYLAPPALTPVMEASYRCGLGDGVRLLEAR